MVKSCLFCELFDQSLDGAGTHIAVHGFVMIDGIKKKTDVSPAQVKPKLSSF
jgi:hypothetical protein